MNLSNYRSKNSFVSLQLCFVLLFLFDCILNIVPIALIALEAAIKRSSLKYVFLFLKYLKTHP